MTHFAPSVETAFSKILVFFWQEINDSLTTSELLQERQNIK